MTQINPLMLNPSHSPPTSFSRIQLNPWFSENKVGKTSPTFEHIVTCSLQNYVSLKKNKVSQACTHSFNSFAVHLVMLVSFSEVKASITFLAYQKIRKIYLHIEKRINYFTILTRVCIIQINNPTYEGKVPDNTKNSLLWLKHNSNVTKIAGDELCPIAMVIIFCMKEFSHCIN